MTDEGQGVNDDERKLPTDEDPIGTRYVRDGDGEIILDRRPEVSPAFRAGLIWAFMLMLFILTCFSVLGYFDNRSKASDLKDVQESLAVAQSDLEATQAQAVHDAKKNDYLVRLAQRNGCDQGNELRQGLRRLVKDQIESAETTPPELFPSIPPDVFRDLIAERVAELRALIDENFKPVDCRQKYPLFDNPDTAADETGL